MTMFLYYTPLAYNFKINIIMYGDYGHPFIQFFNLWVSMFNLTEVEAQVWGRLRVPNYENALDKQIAATALTNGLTVVSRNIGDFTGTGVKLINPFK